MPSQRLPGPAKPGKRKPLPRRAAARFLPAQEIICYWSDGGPYQRGRVCDVSAGGACLLIPGRVGTGAVLSVEMVNGPHTTLCARNLQVLRVFEGNGKDMVVGGAFDRKLDYDELLAFIL